MLTPVHLVWIIFSAIIILSVLLAFLRSDSRLFLKNNYKTLLFIIVISIVSTLPLDFNFFYGLSYEDAYVFTGHSRFLLYNNDFSHDPFQTKGCLMGSLKYCESVGTYGGHFIGLSSIGFFFNKYFEYSPLIICFINFFVSLVSVCLIYCVSYLIYQDRIIGVICSLVYSLSPVMSLFHTSGLAETLSSTSIIFTLFLYLLIIEKPKNFNHICEAILWLLLLLSLSFCLLQKRENLIMLFLPMISLVRILINNNYYKNIILKATIVMAAGIAIFLVFHYGINVLDIERQESQDIAAATFSIKYFFTLAPIFIKSFFTFKWFFVFSIFTFAGYFRICAKIKRHPLYIYPTILFIAYLLAYTLHYMSYYFVKFGQIHEFESLRYITNFFPFYCLIGGYAIFNLMDSLKQKIKPLKPFMVGISIFLIGYLIYANINLKKDFFAIEQENRIAPIEKTISLIEQEGSTIITDVPLIFQVLGNDTLQIIDMPSIGREIPIFNVREKMHRSQNTYYLRSCLTDKYQHERYPTAMNFIDSLKLVKIKEYSSRYYELYSVRDHSQ